MKIPRGELVALILCTQSACVSGNGVYLDLSEKPGKAVRIVSSATAEALVNVEGGEDLIAEYRQQGLSFPLQTTSYRSLRVTKVTGLARKDGSFSIVLRVEDAESYVAGPAGTNTDSKADMIGMALKGVVDADGKVELFQLSGSGLGIKKRVAYYKLFENLLSQMALPKRLVNVGEHFSLPVQLDLSMPGHTVKVDSKLDYTLKGVEGDMALFDVTSKYGLFDRSGVVEIIGSGSGIMKYNVKSRLMESQRLMSTARVTIDVGEGKLSANITSESEVKQYNFRPQRASRKQRPPAISECISGRGDRYQLLPRKRSGSECVY